MKIIILSDIHGNKAALQSVLNRAAQYPDIEACILLGDTIDYGMHSNKAVKMLKNLPYPVLCNIRGNHEDAIINEKYGRFSSLRGVNCAKYTRSILEKRSLDYIKYEMSGRGRAEFECCGKKCLAVHGSLEDEYWTSIQPEDAAAEYGEYDYVFSGHSHQPHFVEKYIACDDARYRNRKKVIFINPGSVGQPRNLNPRAQFVILDMETEQVLFEKVKYDIAAEQASFHGQVDDFYRERLKWGI